jgi:hypothetical protein
VTPISIDVGALSRTPQDFEHPVQAAFHCENEDDGCKELLPVLRDHFQPEKVKKVSFPLADSK